MKNPKHIYAFFLLVFLIQTLSQANQISPSLRDSNSISFQHNKSGKTGTIYAEQEVKVWVEDKIVMGVFKKTDGVNMTVLSKGEEVEIPLSKLTKIRAYKDGSKKMIGILIRGIGLIGLLLGGISLVAGIISLATGSLGAIIIVAVPFLLLPGFLLYKLGSNISGQTFKLDGKWTLKQ